MRKSVIEQVLLVSPSFSGSTRGFPLGLGYLGAALEDEGFVVHVLDMVAQGISRIQLADYLAKVQPDVVGISAGSATYLDALGVVEVTRQVLGPSPVVILGGPHVAFGSDVILSYHNDIDFCVLGEGELTLIALLREISRSEPKPEDVSGIAFGVGSKVVRTRSRPLMADIDRTPLPARHLFDMRKYTSAISAFEDGSTRNAELIASRGCPYPCGFCSTKEFWRRKSRRRSAAHVLSELIWLSQRGYTDLYFLDDIFTIHREWTMELCDLIIEHELPVRWACGTRVDRVDKELLLAMKRAGCAYIYFGIESRDDRILRTQQKNIPPAQVEACFALVKELDFYSSAALIFGLPGETWETARKTIEWVHRTLRPDEVWISKACCYPGTPLARHLGVTAEDYETRVQGRCSKGWVYQASGIQTPFFCDQELVARIWDLIHTELGQLKLGFADEQYPYMGAG